MLDTDLLLTVNNIYNGAKYAVPTTIALLLFIGLLGNCLVIYVTITTQRVTKHPVHSVLVLNLAVSDIIYLLASGPYQASANVEPGWIYGSFMCPLLHFLNILTMAVSIFTMCSLALMRFLALMMPFKIQRSFIATSPRFTGGIIIFIVWILAIILSIPVLVFFRVAYFPSPDYTNKDDGPDDYHLNSTIIDEEPMEPSVVDNGIVECSWRDKSADNINNVILLIMTYIIPFLLVVILYSLIIKEIHFGMTPVERNEQSEYVKTTIMVFFLIIAFLVCWFPHHLFTMLLTIRPECNTNASCYLFSVVIELLGICTSYAHACVNPIIYTFASPGFRRSLRFSLRKSFPAYGGSKKRNSCMVRRAWKIRYENSRGTKRNKKLRHAIAADQSQTTKLTSPTLGHVDRSKVTPPK